MKKCRGEEKEHQRGADPDEPDADDSESELMEKKLKKSVNRWEKNPSIGRE